MDTAQQGIGWAGGGGEEGRWLSGEYRPQLWVLPPKQIKTTQTTNEILKIPHCFSQTPSGGTGLRTSFRLRHLFQLLTSINDSHICHVT